MPKRRLCSIWEDHIKDKTSEAVIERWRKEKQATNKNQGKTQETRSVTLYGQKRWSSKKGRREDALALRAEERRDKLRKAAGRSKYPESRGFLNGETHMERLHVSMPESIGDGGEPGELKHLSSRRKRKKHRFPK